VVNAGGDEDIKKDVSNMELTTLDENSVVKREASSIPRGKSKTERQRSRQKHKTKKQRRKRNKLSRKRKRKKLQRKLKPNRRTINKKSKKKKKKERKGSRRMKLRKRNQHGAKMNRERKKKNKQIKSGGGRNRSKKRPKQRKHHNQKEQKKRKEKLERKTQRLSKSQREKNRKKRIRKTNFTTCAEKLFSYSKMALGIAVNVEKQVNTATTRSKTVTNKKGKKSDFEAPLGTLLTALGGNASALQCAGKPLRSTKYKDTLSTLRGCEAKINTSCNYTISAAIKTEISKCKTKATKLRSEVLTCSKKATTEAGCTCLNSINITAKELKECKNTTLKVRNEAVKNKNDCITAFRACKTAQDAAVDGVGTCKKVNKCGGAMNKTEALKLLKILKPLQEALKNKAFENALKKLGLNTGTGSDGNGYDGSRMSRLSQLRLARYDARNEERNSNSSDSAGCLEIVKEWKSFNTSADKAVPSVGGDVDSSETNKTIKSLKKLNQRANLTSDLGSCAKTSRQGSVLSIVKIRFYLFWAGWFKTYVVEIKVITLESSFGVSSPSSSSSVVTAAPEGRHIVNQMIRRAAWKQQRKQLT